MFDRKIKIEIEFKEEEANLFPYLETSAFEEMLKYIKNTMINYINKGEYEKANTIKDLLSDLYTIKKTGQKIINN